jgi:hypothetical protein
MSVALAAVLIWTAFLGVVVFAIWSEESRMMKIACRPSPRCSYCGFDMSTPQRAHDFIHQQGEAICKNIGAIVACRRYVDECERTMRTVADYLEANADPANPEDRDNWVLPCVRILRSALEKKARETHT